MDSNYVLGGDLNPILGFCFPLFSMVFPGSFHQGRNLWKWAEAKVWSFVADLPTNFLCVLIVLCLSTDCGMLIDRNDLPNHIFGITDLDLSEDLCAEPLAGAWFRLGTCSTGSGSDGQGPLLVPFFCNT